jgi:hypothetical protein
VQEDLDRDISFITNEPGLGPHEERRALTGAMDKELPCLTRIVEPLSPRPIRAQKYAVVSVQAHSL